jgi:hypothetical protein
MKRKKKILITIYRVKWKGVMREKITYTFGVGKK